VTVAMSPTPCFLAMISNSVAYKDQHEQAKQREIHHQH
jgi:hypothetical protein